MPGLCNVFFFVPRFAHFGGVAFSPATFFVAHPSICFALLSLLWLSPWMHKPTSGQGWARLQWKRSKSLRTAQVSQRPNPRAEERSGVCLGLYAHVGCPSTCSHVKSAPHIWLLVLLNVKLWLNVLQIHRCFCDTGSSNSFIGW